MWMEYMQSQGTNRLDVEASTWGYNSKDISGENTDVGGLLYLQVGELPAAGYGVVVAPAILVAA